MNNRILNIIGNFLNEKIKNPLIVIVGPTASGKTQLSLDIAQSFSGEVISADSRQIYKYMDIGTGKILPEEMENIPHFMLDVICPDEKYSVGEFKRESEKHISEIQKRGNIPLLVGGTGLYIDAVAYNFAFPDTEGESQLRRELDAEYEKYGGEVLYEKLQKLDPFGATKVHPNNKHHLIRALEVVLKTGISKFKQSTRDPQKYDTLFLGIEWEREVLYNRINTRVEGMFVNGLIKETEKLLSMGYGAELSSMSGIGYGECVQYLDSKISKEEAIERTQQRSRNYAKRQLTWFRKNKDIIWIK